jgi:hypothetical protein
MEVLICDRKVNFFLIKLGICFQSRTFQQVSHNLFLVHGRMVTISLQLICKESNILILLIEDIAHSNQIYTTFGSHAHSLEFYHIVFSIDFFLKSHGKSSCWYVRIPNPLKLFVHMVFIFLYTQSI